MECNKLGFFEIETSHLLRVNISKCKCCTSPRVTVTCMPAMFHTKETLASAIENPIVSMIFCDF
jgi:hypothetical protein